MSIKVNELRIGNYLMDGKGRLCIVDQIEKHKFNAPAIHGPTTTVKPGHKPVRLTTDWMMVLGFKRMDKYTYVYKGLFIHHRRTGFKWGKVKVEFVHDLQNIVYANKKLDLIILDK